MTPSQMYEDTRIRLSELLGSLTDDELGTLVPATPAWTVSDVARHLAGVCDDVLAGRVEGAATDPWTHRQVEARRAAGVDEVLAEWAELAPKMAAVFDAAGPVAYRLVIDVVTHEHDVRGAVGRPGGRDTAACRWALQQLVAYLDGVIRARGLPPLRICAGTDEWLLGDGPPAVTLTADPFELLRALIGRRSTSQIRRFSWEGDPEPYAARFSVFPPPVADLVE